MEEFSGVCQCLLARKAAARDVILKVCPDRLHTILPGVVLMEQVCNALNCKVLYISGEEAAEQIKLRSKEHYRGVKKYPNVYSGFLVCGDCGSPMFSMSRPDLAPAYVCGEYHTRGKKDCTSHHVRVDFLDSLLKRYLQRVRENAGDMFEKLNVMLQGEASDIRGNTETAEMLRAQIERANEEVREYVKQKARDTIKNPDQAKIVADAYDRLIEETSNYILGLQNQLELVANKRNAVIEANRTAMTAIEVFDRILNKESLDREDLSLLVEKIYVYEDHIDVQLKADIDALLGLGGKEGAVNFNGDAVKPVTLILKTKNQKDKVYSVRVIGDGDPLEIFTDRDELMLKKYSPIATLERFSEGTTRSLNDLSGYLFERLSRRHLRHRRGALRGGRRAERVRQKAHFRRARPHPARQAQLCRQPFGRGQHRSPHRRRRRGGDGAGHRAHRGGRRLSGGGIARVHAGGRAHGTRGAQAVPPDGGHPRQPVRLSQKTGAPRGLRCALRPFYPWLRCALRPSFYILYKERKTAAFGWSCRRAGISFFIILKKRNTGFWGGRRAYF